MNPGNLSYLRGSRRAIPSRSTIEDEGDNGLRRVARGSAVNDDQVDGFAVPEAVESLGPDHLAAADAFVTGTRTKVEHGGERAYYRSSTDHIQMPDEGLFTGTATMAGTVGLCDAGQRAGSPGRCGPRRWLASRIRAESALDVRVLFFMQCLLESCHGQ